MTANHAGADYVSAGRAFSPPQPTFPTVTLYFEGLPSVALIIPDPTSLNELARIQGVIAQQLTLKAIAITAETLQARQPQPERILGPDEAALVSNG